MTASINGRALTDGEFVCVINGLTYVGRAQDWNYIQQSDQRLPTVTLNGVITDQQRNEPPADTQQRAVLHAPAGPRGRLTVQILPLSQLPLVGDHDTLYCVSVEIGGEGREVFDENAYVYRPVDREGGDPAPYKATNVSATIVARLYDSGDQIPSQAAITPFSSAVPVHYVIADQPNDQLEVRTRDDFLAWMPIVWRLSEITTRSRPGHLISSMRRGPSSVAAELAGFSAEEDRQFMASLNNAFDLTVDLDDETRRELLQRGLGMRNTVAAALRTTIPDRPLPAPVVTYVSGLDELPVQGEEHRLYCIYGYAAAYVYRRGHSPAYRPTNLSAAALAENYPDGATLQRVSADTLSRIVLTFHSGAVGWCVWRATDAQGDYYCCAGQLYLEISARGEPLEGRRDNTADHAFTLPAGTAIPTRAIQGDPVVVPIPRLTPEQLNEARGVAARPTPQELFSRTPAIPRAHLTTYTRLDAAASATWASPILAPRPVSERPTPPLPEPRHTPVPISDDRPRRLLLQD